MTADRLLASPGRPAGPSARIIVVDDEQAHMTALCDTLQGRGFAAVGFASPAEALAALKRDDFDLLLTDLMMPVMDGIELLGAAQEIRPHLVGVLMTGHGTIDSAVEAMKVGALDYIQKPFRLGSLLPVLTRALAVRQLRLENAALEKRILRRTRELEIANRDLEAFSFSVSHDLMAPLRSVRGYADILDRECSEQLPASSQAYLKRMIAGADRMQALIRDLLRFSRLGLRPADRHPVSVSNMVQEVVRELLENETLRQVEVRVGDLPDAHADASLLRQVFVNLFSNAMKFTRRQERPLIEVGSRLQDGEVVYFVRDNGSGFDMKHASRLFGVFSRLHNEEQFEGTGIGLSMVRRIIEHHGGRVWAEGEVDKGATVSFCLSEADPDSAS